MAVESAQRGPIRGRQFERSLHPADRGARPGRQGARPHSACPPDFYRIYRVDQAADVVRSTATGTDRVQKVSFKVVGQPLTQLFDGTEQLISITSIPLYTRQLFLPGAGTQ